MIPIAGSPLAETVGFVGQRIVDKRLQQFFDAVISGLERMQVQVDQLNDSFWSTFLHAAEAARRTLQREKFEALKSAVLNAAKPSAPHDDLQHIFVNIVDELTPLHLRLFGFLLHPELFGMDVESFRELHGLNPNNPGAAWDAIETHVAPATRRDLIYMCFNDLINRGLVAYSDDPGPVQGAILPWPANIGWDFYSFISSEDKQPDAGNDRTA
jgi:hypothetical protein